MHEVTHILVSNSRRTARRVAEEVDATRCPWAAYSLVIDVHGTIGELGARPSTCLSSLGRSLLFLVLLYQLADHSVGWLRDPAFPREHTIVQTLRSPRSVEAAACRRRPTCKCLAVTPQTAVTSGGGRAPHREHIFRRWRVASAGRPPRSDSSEEGRVSRHHCFKQ